MGPAPLPTFPLPFLGPFGPSPTPFLSKPLPLPTLALHCRGRESVCRECKSVGREGRGGSRTICGGRRKEKNRTGCVLPPTFPPPNRLEDKKRGLGSLLAQKFCTTFCRQYTYTRILLKCAKANLPFTLERSTSNIATFRVVL